MNIILKSTKGFTLIELLISIAIFGIIVTLMMDSNIEQQNQNITQLQAVEVQQSVRAAVYLMSAEIRSAGYNPGYKTYDTGITNATLNTLTFNRINSDGELEIITYTLQDSDGDGDLDITVAYNGGGPNSLVENIQNLTFVYFDVNGAVTADLSAIRSIQLTITATTNK